jgi:NDP-4-keto-2,6-dideoxyhexose 3-C-methyltransferase
MPRRIETCRICANPELVQVLDLGEQALTGVFPSQRTQKVTTGPLRLVKCTGGPGVCGLLQLEHSYDSAEMYGLNYGYRSGLNSSMVRHLHSKVQKLLKNAGPKRGALILDIGSNDSTTLQAYPAGEYSLVGMDPTGVKFKSYYPDHVELIPDFFSAASFKGRFGSRKASIITSFSMFYDLEDPTAFMRDIAEILEDDGVWIFEQSYMPAMLERNSYDTVCHEHVEYYALAQIAWMAERAGLVLLDVELNDVNGGSFSVTAARRGTGRTAAPNVGELLAQEAKLGFDTLRPYREFAERTRKSREALLEFLNSAMRKGESVCGLGASTKGNVLLQYCGIRPPLLEEIGEVNAEKYGHFTPGTLIPIASEAEVLKRGHDHMLVLPWHFRPFFLGNDKFRGRSLVFPLPTLEVVAT